METAEAPKQAVEMKTPSVVPTPSLKKFPKPDFLSKLALPAVALVIVAVGVALGWFLSGHKVGGRALVPGQTTSSDKAVVSGSSTEAGLKDATGDTAQGTLEAGGISGEGTHHLTRPGGSSQTVYLTSTIVDLDQFVGKKVEVTGQTVSSRKAGWLLDVQRIKVIE
jgi:hypothetical protein